MDFTLTTYQKLLTTLKNQEYTFQPFAEAIEKPRANTIILRHDVDLHPENALRTAKIEQSLGIRSTYFFRIIPETFKPEIIQQIADLGHEIGYHYEDLTLAGEEVGGQKSEVGDQKSEVGGQKSENGDRRSEVRSQEKKGKGKNKEEIGTGAESLPGSCRGPRGAQGQKTENRNHVETHGRASIKRNPRRDKACLVSCLVSRLFPKKTNPPENKNILIDHAYQLFCHHLEQLRQYADIKTICMHGSPKSRYDSKDIWENRQGAGQEYDYRQLGIIGEPYFDIDFDQVFYLTDTGRRWDGWKVSLRDKVPQQERWEKEGLVFHSTKDIIKAAENNQLPGKIMITTHPQRWTDKPLPWLKELVWQGVKNVGKRILVARGR